MMAVWGWWDYVDRPELTVTLFAKLSSYLSCSLADEVKTDFN